MRTYRSVAKSWWMPVDVRSPSCPRATSRCEALQTEVGVEPFGRAAVGAAAPSCLFPQGDVADDHAAVDRLAHVVDGEARDRAGGHRLHLDAGAVDGLDLRLDLDVVVFDAEVDEHRAYQQWVAQGDQIGRALGGLDARHARDGEHVALGDRTARYEGRGIRAHVYAPARDGASVGGILRRDVDHASPAEWIEVREPAVGHGDSLDLGATCTGRRRPWRFQRSDPVFAGTPSRRSGSCCGGGARTGPGRSCDPPTCRPRSAAPPRRPRGRTPRRAEE